MNPVTIFPVIGIGEIVDGDDLASLIVSAAGREAFRDRDVLVIAQKALSKAEGRVVAEERASAVARESLRVLRRSGDMVISETRHGFVCANAGVDSSNVPEGRVALLPEDPDLSARRLRARVERLIGRSISVIVSDTFGRAWRLGQTNVAIGVAGMDPFLDHRGTIDTHGHVLVATRICIADEIAGAAEIVMGKSRGICAAIVRGIELRAGRGAASDIVRPPGEDFFR